MATPLSKEQHAKVVELLCAVKEGQKNEIKSIVQGQGHNFPVKHILNSAIRFAKGFTPLRPTTALLEACHKANADHGDARYQGRQEEALEIVKLLLHHGADPDMKACCPDAGNLIPLHMAVKESNLSLTNVLLEGKASVNQMDDGGRSALHICCQGGKGETKADSEILNTLISHKADVNLQDNRGKTPLNVCIPATTQHDMMRSLLDNGALTDIPDERGESPLHTAARCGDEISVQILLESKASVNQTNHHGQTALHKCCMRLRHYEPQLALVNILISYKADVNLQDKNGETPLNISLENRKLDMAMVLLKNDALATIPDSAGECPLHKAVEYGELSLVRKMLEGSASVNQTDHDGQSALHKCCAGLWTIEPYLEILNTLISHKVDVNLQDKNGETPLHLSLENRKFDMAMVLLQNGALATIPDSEGKWPLHTAVESGEQRLVRKILEGKASANKANQTVNKIDRNGKSALHILCGKSYRNSYNTQILMELIKYKADVNLQDKEGQTPTHISCVTKKWDLTMALLQNGALATILDNAGKCPLHEVASNNPEAILGMVNLCAIKRYENTELIIEACELAAMCKACPYSFECMHKATLLRIEHAIPKITLEPMECYGFCKEWETIEELETCDDENQLKLQAILAKERIHQGQHEKLMPLIQEDLISVVLSARKSEAGELLKHHLNIWSSCTSDGNKLASFEDLLKAWTNTVEKCFESFDTMSIVQFTQLAIENLADSARFGRYDSVLLPNITTLIMKLYRRKRQVEGTSKNEEMLAKDLLQQLLDTDKGGEQYPMQHQVTEQSFRTLGYSYTASCDYELMKMLLESRIEVNAVDSYGNTMLHAAVGCIYENTVRQNWLIRDQSIRTIKLLLDKGVYPNAQNNKCHTARNKLGAVRLNGDERIAPTDVEGRIYRILQQYELRNSITLKHMTAVAVKKSGYSYENILPDPLVKFVDLHKPRR